MDDVFRTTDYCVEYEHAVVNLRVGKATPAPLAGWIATHNGSTPAWLITAHNPGGEAAGDAGNRARQWLLDILLDRPHWARLPAINRDSTGHWPDEPGWLVAGLEEGLARSLARRFTQAAVIAVGTKRVDLLWCV